MEAKYAKAISRAARESGLTRYRQGLLEKIKEAANVGETSIQIEEQKIESETVKWFEDLGYKVIAPDYKIVVPKGYNALNSNPLDRTYVFVPGIISWEENAPET